MLVKVCIATKDGAEAVSQSLYRYHHGIPHNIKHEPRKWTAVSGLLDLTQN